MHSLEPCSRKLRCDFLSSIHRLINPHSFLRPPPLRISLMLQRSTSLLHLRFINLNLRKVDPIRNIEHFLLNPHRILPRQRRFRRPKSLLFSPSSHLHQTARSERGDGFQPLLPAPAFSAGVWVVCVAGVWGRGFFDRRIDFNGLSRWEIFFKLEFANFGFFGDQLSAFYTVKRLGRVCPPCLRSLLLPRISSFLPWKTALELCLLRSLLDWMRLSLVYLLKLLQLKILPHLLL